MNQVVAAVAAAILSKRDDNSATPSAQDAANLLLSLPSLDSSSSSSSSSSTSSASSGGTQGDNGDGGADFPTLVLARQVLCGVYSCWLLLTTVAFLRQRQKHAIAQRGFAWSLAIGSIGHAVAALYPFPTMKYDVDTHKLTDDMSTVYVQTCAVCVWWLFVVLVRYDKLFATRRQRGMRQREAEQSEPLRFDDDSPLAEATLAEAKVQVAESDSTLAAVALEQGQISIPPLATTPTTDKFDVRAHHRQTWMDLFAPTADQSMSFDPYRSLGRMSVSELLTTAEMSHHIARPAAAVQRVANTALPAAPSLHRLPRSPLVNEIPGAANTLNTTTLRSVRFSSRTTTYSRLPSLKRVDSSLDTSDIERASPVIATCWSVTVKVVLYIPLSMMSVFFAQMFTSSLYPARRGNQFAVFVPQSMEALARFSPIYVTVHLPICITAVYLLFHCRFQILASRPGRPNLRLAALDRDMRFMLLLAVPLAVWAWIWNTFPVFARARMCAAGDVWGLLVLLACHVRLIVVPLWRSIDWSTH